MSVQHFGWGADQGEGAFRTLASSSVVNSSKDSSRGTSIVLSSAGNEGEVCVSGKGASSSLNDGREVVGIGGTWTKSIVLWSDGEVEEHAMASTRKRKRGQREHSRNNKEHNGDDTESKVEDVDVIVCVSRPLQVYAQTHGA
jgi:hypothetical protein